MLDIKKIDNLLFILCSGIFISSLFAIVQYFNIGNLGENIYLLYGEENNIKYGIDRAIGMLGNPNYASYFHSIGFILALNIHSTKIKERFFKYLLIFVSFSGVILTFSRTGIFVLFFVWFLFLIIKKKVTKILSLIFIIFLFFIYYIDLIMNKTRFGRIFGGDFGGSISDFGNRSNLIWEHRILSFYEYPFFGTGPAKNEVSKTIFGSTIYDNVYLLLIITSGVIGLLIFIYLYIQMIKPFIRNKFKNNQFKSIIIPVFIMTVLFFMTTDLIWNINFVAFYYLIFGIFYSLNIRHIKHEKFRSVN